MERSTSGYMALIGCLGLMIALIDSPLARAQSCAQPVATIVSLQGTIESRRMGETQWQAVKLNETYCPGDAIRTAGNSRAEITLMNHSVLRINENTSITIDDVKADQRSVIGLLQGVGHFFSHLTNRLEVVTPWTVVGVRGTEFLMVAKADELLVSILDEGSVRVQNEVGNLMLTGGQSAVVKPGEAPVRRLIARPRDAVQWALHYPPVVNPARDATGAASRAEDLVQKANAAYLKGELQDAFDLMAQVPKRHHDTAFLTFRASLFLAVGAVDKAKADIEKALRLQPDEVDALALQTIIAVVQNDVEQARHLAQRAVAAGPKTATAYIARSYVEQAMFDLSGARKSVEQAVRLAPENALAWARRAELLASFGELNQALKAAQKAEQLEPDLARTQTVLGFVYLTQVKTRPARAAFEKAVRLDQADPLPRLGLGLADMREGKRTEGRRQIEIAASLDPNHALIRSYLGKAYYEAKRAVFDTREYNTAKQLDPQDPTPWLYDAISKQTANRPVEALHDIQKAIELNDNRAVYRSRLLLDSDLASRSAGLARIYSDLGFQQRALVEGWRSLNADPTNFSAHRFLADSYGALPRHEIARVSELLQSQLLQPLSLTPIQPQLAESNLFLISAGGPGALSFNEFTPLFTGDQWVVQANGLAGEQGTYAGEGVASGIYKKLSFSVGASHFESDGFRPNSDQEDDIINTFVQLELSHQTSLQAEYRYRNNQRGDLQQRFFTEDFFPGLRNRDERHTVRLGARHALSPRSTLLGSFIYQTFDADLRDDPAPFPGFRFFDFKLPGESFSIEAQHLFRTSLINVISGGGYINNSGDIASIIGLDLPPPPDGPGPLDIPGTQSTDFEHIVVYAYAHLHLIKDVTLTVGASYNMLSGAEDILPQGDQKQFNPKFGLIWQPRPNTTVRAAAFRVLKRELTTDQTLEPTQVAGFNQFYDDAGATDVWRYGVAIDQKFTDALFGGVEVSKRDLTVPLLTSDPATGELLSETSDAEEYAGRAYLFWAPHSRLSLRAEYLFERFKNEKVYSEVPLELDTHRVPLGLNLFSPSGLNASLTATYWHQDGEFERPIDLSVQSGHTDFWTVDATLNYRLPKRYGFVTVGATNLFDEPFRFYNTDFDNLTIVPDRRFFARITLALP